MSPQPAPPPRAQPARVLPRCSPRPRGRGPGGGQDWGWDRRSQSAGVPDEPPSAPVWGDIRIGLPAGLNSEKVAALIQKLNSDPQFVLAQNVGTTHDLLDVCLKRAAVQAAQHVFQHAVAQEGKPVTNQKASGGLPKPPRPSRQGPSRRGAEVRVERTGSKFLEDRYRGRQVQVQDLGAC